MTISIGLADIIQSLGIIVTLVIAIWQMAVQTRHVRAANDLALLIKFDELNKLWIDHPGVWSLLDAPHKEGQSENSLEVLENIMFMVFNTLELAFRHHRKYRLVEREEWRDWRNTIQIYRGKAYYRDWWARNAHEYSDSFRAYVNGLPSPTTTKNATQKGEWIKPGF